MCLMFTWVSTEWLIFFPILEDYLLILMIFMFEILPDVTEKFWILTRKNLPGWSRKTLPNENLNAAAGHKAKYTEIKIWWIFLFKYVLTHNRLFVAPGQTKLLKSVCSFKWLKVQVKCEKRLSLIWKGLLFKSRIV